MSWAAEHVVGVAKGVSEDILRGSSCKLQGECSEVGMYLAMARVAHREVIRKLACTTRKPLTKRLSTLLNSQSSWAKS